MTLSRYQVAPRQGHLDRAKQIFGYLKKYKYGAIRICTGLPDHSKFVDQAFDCMYSAYGSVAKDLPKKALIGQREARVDCSLHIVVRFRVGCRNA